MANADTSRPAESPNLLVIGDLFSPTMTPVRQCVEKLVETRCDAHFLKGIPQSAVGPAGEDWFPDLVIACQHWPDEYTERDVLRLIGLFPLARIACCYGPWCQADGRRRDIWPLAVRVPVELAAERIDRELEVLAGRRRPLPLTASRDEVFLFDAAL
jgi:hypothetical protein